MPRILSVLLLLVIQGSLQAGDWPGWLGPRRDGSSPEKIAPWKGDLKPLWKAPVGEGHSSPVVAKGRVYLHTAVKGKPVEQLSAFDAVTGKPLWTQSYERAGYTDLFGFGQGPRATPTVVDGKVYTFGITGVLTCFDADKAAILWSLDTLKTFKAANLFFGSSCSPLVVGDRILLNVGGEGASIVAIDRHKGKVLWQKLDDKATYSSGILVKRGNVEEAIFLTAKGLVSLSPEDGKVYWQSPLVDKLNESSTTPVMIGGNAIFASSVTFGGMALKLVDADSKPAVKKEWVKPELACYFSTPIAVGQQYLYIVTSKGKGINFSSTLRCIEASSGKELWNRPKVGKYHASLLRTGDDKLLMLEEFGQLVMIDPDPKEFKELARAKICGNTWAHPALADGRYYIRDGTDLICVPLN